MKKIIPLLCIVAASVMLQSNSSVHVVAQEQISSKKNARLVYTWYWDENLTLGTGTVSTIPVEIERLQQLYSSNTFSTEPSGGLIAYEWGDYYPFDPIIIYSDLYAK